MAKVVHKEFRGIKMGSRWGEIDIDADGNAEIPDDAVETLTSGPFGFYLPGEVPTGDDQEDATKPSMESAVIAQEERKRLPESDEEEKEEPVEEEAPARPRKKKKKVVKKKKKKTKRTRE